MTKKQIREIRSGMLANYQSEKIKKPMVLIRELHKLNFTKRTKK